MDYTIEALSTLERQLTVRVPAEKVNVTIDSLIARKKDGLELDGFRKGRVSTQIVEERFGVEIRSQATEQLMKEYISDILDKEVLNPVSSFRFDALSNFDISRNREFIFTCSFEVMPNIDLPDFSTFSVEVEDVVVRKSSLSRLTRNMIRRFGKIEEVKEKRHPRAGDIVLVTIRAHAGKKRFLGFDSHKQYIQISGEEIFPEIEKILCTLVKGSEGKGEFVCPDDYIDPEVRGSKINFSVFLHNIFIENFPDIDDELAHKLGQRDANSLKKYIFECELNSELKRIKAEGQQKLLKSILDTLDFSLPNSMIKKEVGSYLVTARNILAQNGIEHSESEQILKKIRYEAEKNARYQVKAQCFLMAVGYKEQIKVYQRDADLAIRRMAQESHQDYEKLREHLHKSGAINDLQERLMAAKALDFVYDKACKIVVDKDGKPLPPPSLVI